jgi:hypothetical protein
MKCCSNSTDMNYKKNVLGILLVTLVFVSSCAISSQISRYSESRTYFNSQPRLIKNEYAESDIYTLYERGSTGFVSIQTLRSNLERRAELFAYRQNKSFIVLGEKISEPPYILGNFPRIQIVFALIDKSN